MRCVLVTGGCGFIGSNFIDYLMRTTSDVHVVNVDKLTYAANLANLLKWGRDPRYHFEWGDICDNRHVRRILMEFPVEGVINFAAESHVDRSIEDPGVFIRTNVVGTQTLLDAARDMEVGKFLQVSTDEVYGSLGATGKFTETTPIAPNSPYSASKAAADHLVHAYHHTFGMHTVITRCSNNYGPHQFPEKMIPLMYLRALEGKPLPVYGDGLQVRDWLHVEDHCRAVWQAYQHGKSGRIYNVGGDSEKTNLDVVNSILDYVGAPKSLIRHVTDRPGHDRRYAIDASRIRDELAWQPTIEFREGLYQTLAWYDANQQWLADVTSGSYREDCAKRYSF